MDGNEQKEWALPGSLWFSVPRNKYLYFDLIKSTS